MRWHLDEMVVSLSGKQMYMWRANERCNASNQQNLLSVSLRSMRRSTTNSMFNGILSAGGRIDRFGPQRINLGAMRQLR
jgi:transposase-like protein